MPRWAPNKLPLSVKKRYFELLRQGYKGAAAARVVGVLMLVCDGLSGLPDAVTTVWPRTVVRTCIVHLLCNSFRCAGRQHWDAKAIKPVYTAPTEAAARERNAHVRRAVKACGHFPHEPGRRTQLTLFNPSYTTTRLTDPDPVGRPHRRITCH